jgi:hypothetical protein
MKKQEKLLKENCKENQDASCDANCDVINAETQAVTS